LYNLTQAQGKVVAEIAPDLADRLGRSFDPEAFDVAKATKRMRRGLPDRWKMA